MYHAVWIPLAPSICALSKISVSIEEIAEKSYNIDLCGFPHEEEIILEPMDLILEYQEKRASLNTEIDHVLEKITSMLGGN